jgi:cytochrome P450
MATQDTGADPKAGEFAQSATPGAAAGSSYLPVIGDKKYYRTYEVEQRKRVVDATERFNPAWLLDDTVALRGGGQVEEDPKYRSDPFAILGILRESYPCFHDWLSNRFFVTRYDDVTSILADEPNYQFRSKRYYYGIASEGQGVFDVGRNLRENPEYGEPATPAQVAWAQGVTNHGRAVARELIGNFHKRGRFDLVSEFTQHLPLALLAKILAIPGEDVAWFGQCYLTMARGTMGAVPEREVAGRAAAENLRRYFDPLIVERREQPGDDLISAIALTALAGTPTTGADVVVTLLEGDSETLQGALTNMWFQLLADSEQLAAVFADPERLLKRAYLETLRHSPPILNAVLYTTREVERFGQLFPVGAQVVACAATANRDPRLFADPERFNVLRNDLSYREPRGMYRADGLPAGIAVGLGRPSRYAAKPDDRPPSVYALTRNLAEQASLELLGAIRNPRLAVGASPEMISEFPGEFYTCAKLDVDFDA